MSHGQYIKVKGDSDIYIMDGHTFYAEIISEVPGVSAVLAKIHGDVGSNGKLIKASNLNGRIEPFSNAQYTKIDEFPAIVKNMYNIVASDIDTHGVKFGGGVSKAVAIAHTIKILKKFKLFNDWKHYKSNNDDSKYSMFDIINRISRGDATDKLRICKKCQNVEKLDDMQVFSGTAYCKKCAKGVKVCDNCSNVHTKQMSTLYHGLSFCSPSCEASYRPKMPKMQYAGVPEMKVSDTSFNYISNRMFGLELEVVDLSKVAYYRHLSKHWKCIGDGSVTGTKNAGEFVSIKLRGDAGLIAVNRICDYFIKTGIHVNKTCGYHLHVDVNDLDKNALYNVVKFAKENETVFRGLVPGKRRSNSYCAKMPFPLPDVADLDNMDREDLFHHLIKGKVPASSEKKRFIKDVKRSASIMTRYIWFNLCSVYYRNTIEIRLHHGTVNRMEIINWVKLWVAIIDAAKNGTLPSKKYRRMDTLLADIGTIKSGSVGVKKFYTEMWTKNSKQKGTSEVSSYAARRVADSIAATYGGDEE